MTSDATPAVANLATKLRKFGEVRREFKEAEAEAKRLEAPYRALMSEIVDDMLEAGMSSVNVVGHGTFNLRGTTYSRVIDMPTLLEWAGELGLTNGGVSFEDGAATVRFVIDKKEALVEGTKVDVATMTNGQFSLEVSKSILNDLMEEYEGNVPGVTQFTTRYITVYSKK